MKKQPSNWIEGMAMELKDKQKMKDKLQGLEEEGKRSKDTYS